MKKVIITNASSSLGVNLTNILLKDNNTSVLGYDFKLSKNTPSLYTLLKNDRYSFCEQDLTKPIETSSDEIYHLTPILDKELYLSNKFDYIAREIEILKNILSYSKTVGARMVFVNIFPDTKELNKEYFSYYNALYLMHSLIEEFSIKYKTDYKIAQISDYYGINSIPSKLNNFTGYAIYNAFNNEPIELGCDEYFYLTNAGDVANGLKTIMNNYSKYSKYDITSPNICLKSDVAKLIINFTKSKSEIISDGQMPLEAKYKPDISKLNNELNFRCTKPILEGISETIDFYKVMYFS